jgi:hypothetical protein
MDRTTICVPGLAILLIACLLISGCTTPDTGDQTVQPTATVAGALYSAGDIVKNPKSTASTAWLVIGYDTDADSYERALVYPNADGSWGFRKDARTEKAGRVIMEQVYSDIVEHISPYSVPIVTPTEITPESTISGVTLSATKTVTTTSTASPAPVISKIIPDKGDAGTTVTVTDLVGDHFKNGANVSLRRSGSTDIKATGVRAYTQKSITCSIAIPPEAVAGAWDVVVTNPDGQTATYTNIFSVHRTASALSTTSATSAGTIPVTYIDPSIGHAGNNQIVILGSGFQRGATVKLQKTGQLDINARETIWSSETSIQCFIDIPVGTAGAWDVVVTSPDKTYGTKFAVFSVT